jgi:ribonuclease PH
MLSIADIRCKYDSLKRSASDRDRRHSDIYAVRAGEIERAFPEMFSEDYPKPVIANFIDVAARDTAETLAPLPAFNCSATNMVSDAARKRADKRTKGAA